MRALSTGAMRPRFVATTLCSAGLTFWLMWWGVDQKPQKYTPNNVTAFKKASVFPSSSFQLTNTTSLSGLSDDITIVTAYFNLGKFLKGESSNYFSPNLYHNWMRIFEKIHNPVLAYLEKDEDIKYFAALRENLPSNLTKIIKVTREEMWAFKLRPWIENIYYDPSYPKHHPNTVLPDYSCAMHAKYECMLTSLRSNPFRTKYFAWLDIGLFRDLKISEQKIFSLGLPPYFEESKVAYTAVYNTNKIYIEPRRVFHSNMVWVCGCYFVAKIDVMMTWVHDYIRATEHFLEMNLMNTDQQIILAMHQDKNFTRHASVSTYRSNGRYNAWFHLGYLSKENGRTYE